MQIFDPNVEEVLKLANIIQTRAWKFAINVPLLQKLFLFAFAESLSAGHSIP